MAPTLHDIPNELFERVVELLEPSDIFNVRSSCRSLALKATQKRFKSFFRTKHVNLDERSLTDFVHVTESEGLGCLVENLVLVGLVNDPTFLRAKLQDPAAAGGAGDVDVQGDLRVLERRQDELEALHGSKEDVRLLSEAFQNLNKSLHPHPLPSLSLQVRVYFHDAHSHEAPAPLHRRHDRDEPNPTCGANLGIILDVAARTFHTTMEALASSRLTVQKLEVFNSSEMQRCSLVTTELNKIEARHPGLEACFVSLESLSISLCGPALPENAQDEVEEDVDDEDEVEQELDDEDEFGDEGDDEDESPPQSWKITIVRPDDSESHGLCQLLKFAQHLSHLDLHYFDRSHYDVYGWHHPNSALHIHAGGLLLQHTATCSELPSLQFCHIRSLHCDPDDLKVFLQRTRPHRVSLENIVALEGEWRPVFDFLTSTQANTQSLHLHDLFEVQSLGPVHLQLSFGAVASSRGSGRDRRRLPQASTVDRQGDAVRLPIEYHLSAGGQGTPTHWYWVRSRDE